MLFNNGFGGGMILMGLSCLLTSYYMVLINDINLKYLFIFLFCSFIFIPIGVGIIIDTIKKEWGKG
jgi:putative effector of murein hydrolase LrgA (UPF0299 family)